MMNSVFPTVTWPCVAQHKPCVEARDAKHIAKHLSSFNFKPLAHLSTWNREILLYSIHFRAYARALIPRSHAGKCSDSALLEPQLLGTCPKKIEFSNTPTSRTFFFESADASFIANY